MMMGSAQAGDVFSFGPFRLAAGERLLTRDGVPVDLGARALDILVALVSRPNEPVGKRELMAEVWPDVTVEEGSLRFHIVALRKALGDGQDGARYITTLPGRGYCFVAPVLRSAPAGQAADGTASFTGAASLPARLARMVGREEEVRALSAQLAAARFVTVVGPGGVGKTTVAVAVTHDLLEAFAGAAMFVDFGLLADPRLVPVAVASMLGLPIRSEDPVPGLIAHLRGRRFLLVLDSCEHVIDGAAALAAEIFRAAPEVHILATSREALRVEGEQVHFLAPLDSPPDEPGLTAAAAVEFPAAQLFLERAAAAGAPLDLSDADAALVAEICRRLDGVALAIELAAGRVQAYGLRQTAALLDQRLPLSWTGQRNAPPRQRTLQATLDWSYGLLSEPERLVLRRLAVFVGPFTIEAALGVATGGAVDDAALFAAIDSLVAKSMVATRPVGAMMRYRLLDTTRAYALQIADDAERIALAARHAGYYRRWLEQLGGEWPALSNAAVRGPYLSAMNNVRAALDWCFGPGGDAQFGDAQLGVALAAAAAPVFLAMSLLTECRRWSERAVLALGDARGGSDEMHLQAALGMALMFLQGGSDTARAALERALAIAESRGAALGQLVVLGPLHMFHLRTGAFDIALDLGKRGAALAGAVEDPAAAALAHFLLGMSLHLAGDLGGARAALEAALRHQPGGPRASTIYLGFEGQNLSGAILARTLWLQGHPAQAVEQARRAVREAERMDHPVTLSVAMIWAITVFLWTGDLVSAEQHVDWFTARAGTHSLGPYLAVGQTLAGALAVRRGDAEAGVEGLQAGLATLHGARYEVLTTALEIALAEGLAATGRAAEGLALVEDALRRVEARGDLVYKPELLRVKGLLLRATPQAAEACFRQSLDWARRQGALAWELRAATDLAALLADEGRSGEAAALLRPVFERFAEGAETADLQAARRLLSTLG